MPFLRTMFALGRVASLPTIWSNCLAGWWLGGGGNPGKLPLLFAGATLLYLGGAFLNDAFDAGFDRQHRRTRPIPAGAISRGMVWLCGLIWLAVGALSLFFIGKPTGILGLILVFLILVYNALHRLVLFSPVLMGSCRFLLYLVASSAAEQGITGWSVWCGLALMAYVTGLHWFARWQRAPDQIRYWPAFLLGVPVLLALLMDAGPYREAGLLLSAVLVLWVLRCLRRTFWTSEPDLKSTVASLTAGIAFVDWLAACPATITDTAPRALSFVFIAFFLMTLIMQRLVPES